MARSGYGSLGAQKSKGGGGKKVMALLLLVGAGAVGVGAGRGSSTPSITLELSAKAIGPRGQVTARFTEPNRGLTTVKLELIQGGLTKVLCEETFTARAAHEFWGEVKTEHLCDADIGKDEIEELEEGSLELRATAGRAGNWISAPEPTVETRTVEVKLTPPLVSITSEHIFVGQGGAEALGYSVSPGTVKHGVEIGDWFFPGYPLPGGNPGESFALFAVPYNVGSASDLKLVAEDALGNRAVRTGFVHQFFAHPLRSDTINLNDKFIKKVTEEMLPRIKSVKDKGDMLQNYLQLNGELRKENRAKLRELAKGSKPEFLWSETFLPMKNAAVMGAFADHRTYMYDGKPVDTQDHLGFDLASVSRASVEASNRGVVMWADYFGIYGNCVILDHGYGLMTLYAHLSSIAVQKGQTVERAQEVGRSGATGMAGGDHLHFTTLLHGLPTNPVEWWDSHWINDRLKLKLGPALPFKGEGG